jgi:hypothetical protein
MEPIKIEIHIVIHENGTIENKVDPPVHPGNPPVSEIKTILMYCARYAKLGHCCEKVKCRARGLYKGKPLRID